MAGSHPGYHSDERLSLLSYQHRPEADEESRFLWEMPVQPVRDPADAQ